MAQSAIAPSTAACEHSPVSPSHEAYFPPPPLYAEEPRGDSFDDKGNRGTSKESRYKALLMRRTIDEQRLREYARMGLPENLRGDYWKLMLGYLPLKTADWEDTLKRNRKQYEEFVSAVTLNKVAVLEAATPGATIGGVMNAKARIDVDIPRTMPTLQFFSCAEDVKTVNGIPVTFSSNQDTLRRILYVYAALNPGIGYVQGMNEIVGHIMYAFANGRDERVASVEADVFFCFQELQTYIKDNFCRELDFDKDTGVSSTLYAFHRLLDVADPELGKHLDDISLQPEFYAFRWLTLLLSQEFMLPDVLRLWDYLFSFGGPKISSALYFCAVAMVILIRDTLLSLNFATALPLLQSYPADTDVGDVLAIADALIEKYTLDFISEIREHREVVRNSGKPLKAVMLKLKELKGFMKEKFRSNDKK